ncbi:MAG: hypothetical protein V1749_11920 [Candidatus Desantisbacteria bacterium]
MINHGVVFRVILIALAVITPAMGECARASNTQEVFLTVAERFFQPTRQEFASRTVELNPILIEESISGNNHHFSITARNLIHTPQQVRVYPARLSQGLDGEHLITEELWTEKLEINIRPSILMLEPLAEKRVAIDIKIPEGMTGGLYAAIVFESTPLEGSTTIKANAILVLTLPGELIREGTITGTSLLQDKPGEDITVQIMFTNTGNIHIRLDGNVSVRDSLNLGVVNLEIKPAVVIPTCSYQLNTRWKPKDLSVGNYTVGFNINIRDANPIKGLIPFSVIAQNEIGIIRLEIVSFNIPTPRQDEPINFRLFVFNAGNVVLSTTGEVAIRDVKGKEIFTIPIEKEAVLPKSSKELRATLSKGLPIGSYTAEAIINYGDKMKTTKTDFVVGKTCLPKEGMIRNFTIPTVTSGEPISPELVVNNTEGVAICIEGMLEIKDSKGMVIEEAAILRVRLEPGMTQNLMEGVRLMLLPGRYQAMVTLIIGGERVISRQVAFLVEK